MSLFFQRRLRRLRALRQRAKHRAANKMKFEKYVATGNDFLFIDARTAETDSFLEKMQLTRSKLAARLSDRHYGAGADGVVFVELIDSRLKWDFYNSDGSQAEMCGNAARCMGLWAKRELHQDSAVFETLAGPMRVQSVDDGDFEVHFDHLELKNQILPVPAGAPAGVLSLTLLNTGVPHAVLLVEDLKRVSAELLLGKESDMFRHFRFPEPAGARGANVTILEITGEQNYSSVTFERGVEDYTLSCGTGVLAAAAAGLIHSLASGDLQARVKTPGGILNTRFTEDFRSGVLIGPARFVFDANLDEEFSK